MCTWDVPLMSKSPIFDGTFDGLVMGIFLIIAAVTLGSALAVECVNAVA